MDSILVPFGNDGKVIRIRTTHLQDFDSLKYFLSKENVMLAHWQRVSIFALLNNEVSVFMDLNQTIISKPRHKLSSADMTAFQDALLSREFFHLRSAIASKQKALYTSEIDEADRFAGSFYDLLTESSSKDVVGYAQGLLCFYSNKFQEAQDHLKGVSNSSRFIISASMLLGCSFFKTKDYKKALERFVFVLRSCPTAPPSVRSCIGLCHYYLGNVSVAYHAFHRAVTLDATDICGLVGLIGLHLNNRFGYIQEIATSKELRQQFAAQEELCNERMERLVTAHGQNPFVQAFLAFVCLKVNKYGLGNSLAVNSGRTLSLSEELVARNNYVRGRYQHELGLNCQGLSQRIDYFKAAKKYFMLGQQKFLPASFSSILISLVLSLLSFEAKSFNDHVLSNTIDTKAQQERVQQEIVALQSRLLAILKRYPNEPLIRYIHVVLQLRSGQHKAALENMQNWKAGKTMPAFWLTHASILHSLPLTVSNCTESLNCYLIALRLGGFEQGMIEDYDRITACGDPNFVSSVLVHNLGTTYLMLGQIDRAERCFGVSKRLRKDEIASQQENGILKLGCADDGDVPPEKLVNMFWQYLCIHTEFNMSMVKERQGLILEAKNILQGILKKNKQFVHVTLKYCSLIDEISAENLRQARKAGSPQVPQYVAQRKTTVEFIVKTIMDLYKRSVDGAKGKKLVSDYVIALLLKNSQWEAVDDFADTSSQSTANFITIAKLYHTIYLSERTSNASKTLESSFRNLLDLRKNNKNNFYVVLFLAVIMGEMVKRFKTFVEQTNTQTQNMQLKVTFRAMAESTREMFRKLKVIEESNIDVMLGLVQCHILMEDFISAENTLQSFPMQVIEDDAILSIRWKELLMLSVASQGYKLRNQSRYELAQSQFSNIVPLLTDLHRENPENVLIMHNFALISYDLARSMQDCTGFSYYNLERKRINISNTADLQKILKDEYEIRDLFANSKRLFEGAKAYVDTKDLPRRLLPLKRYDYTGFIDRIDGVLDSLSDLIPRLEEQYDVFRKTMETTERERQQQIEEKRRQENEAQERILQEEKERKEMMRKFKDDQQQRLKKAQEELDRESSVPEDKKSKPRRKSKKEAAKEATEAALADISKITVDDELKGYETEESDLESEDEVEAVTIFERANALVEEEKEEAAAAAAAEVDTETLNRARMASEDQAIHAAPTEEPPKKVHRTRVIEDDDDEDDE
ncbi:hypothetical protein PCE1_004940 [Barthelona sp. PCE]